MSDGSEEAGSASDDDILTVCVGCERDFQVHDEDDYWACCNEPSCKEWISVACLTIGQKKTGEMPFSVPNAPRTGSAAP